MGCIAFVILLQAHTNEFRLKLDIAVGVFKNVAYFFSRVQFKK